MREQGTEGIHAYFNSLSRTYQAISGRVDKLNVAPVNVTLRPPVKKLKKADDSHHYTYNIMFSFFTCTKNDCCLTGCTVRNLILCNFNKKVCTRSNNTPLQASHLLGPLQYLVSPVGVVSWHVQTKTAKIYSGSSTAISRKFARTRISRYTVINL